MILKQFGLRWYHIRKPRVVTENKLSLRAYRNQLTAARRQVHQQAIQYQQMIEDEYLQKHAEFMKMKHFNYQCDFRKKISQQGFRLQENIGAWKKEDERRLEKLNNYMHNEDLKRINRERIKKIMTFESQNYWYSSENAEERLTDAVIFPEYVASTEYYHRLHAEALVYENYDFNMLHRLRSNEQVIKEKNKLLIPIFNSIKTKIKQYKTDKEKQIKYLHQIAIDKINMLQNISDSERNKLLQEEQQSFTKKLNEFQARLNDPVKRQNYIKQKLRVLLSILSSWKEYTNILGMTSGQMMKEIEESRRQGNITSIRQNVMSEIRSVKNTTFVDAIQEDTEDVEITLEDYITRLKANQIQEPPVFDQKQAVEVVELDGLLQEAENQLKAEKADLTKPKEEVTKLDLGSMVEGLENPTQLQINDVPLSFLNMNETTSTVEIMKEMYKGDEDMGKLLNQIGEINVEYPKLFNSIWQSTYTVV